MATMFSQHRRFIDELLLEGGHRLPDLDNAL
jgi:hypothetical protein